MTPDRLLRRREVEREVGLSRATIYRQIAAGTFPRPQRTGVRAVAWPTSVIEAWKRSRPATNPAATTAPEPVA